MNAFCPDCGKVLNGKPSCKCGWSEDGRNRPVTACACTAPVRIGRECWSCYDDRTGARETRDRMQYEQLKKIGLGKKPDESKRQWSARCRAWLVKNGGMGKVIARGKEIHGGTQ